MVLHEIFSSHSLNDGFLPFKILRKNAYIDSSWKCIYIYLLCVYTSSVICKHTFIIIELLWLTRKFHWATACITCIRVQLLIVAMSLFSITSLLICTAGRRLIYFAHLHPT